MSERSRMHREAELRLRLRPGSICSDAVSSTVVGRKRVRRRTILEGTAVTVRATPDADHIFTHWKDAGGTVISTQAEFTFVMPPSDITLIAVFADAPPPTTTETTSPTTVSPTTSPTTTEGG